jgi:hypothetical protein
MASDPLTHTELQLFGRQVFEYSVEADDAGNKSTQTLPGFYEIYTQIDGVDVVIDRRKAPGLLADIARAQKAKDAAVPPPAPADLAASDAQPAQ